MLRVNQDGDKAPRSLTTCSTCTEARRTSSVHIRTRRRQRRTTCLPLICHKASIPSLHRGSMFVVQRTHRLGKVNSLLGIHSRPTIHHSFYYLEAMEDLTRLSCFLVRQTPQTYSMSVVRMNLHGLTSRKVGLDNQVVGYIIRLLQLEGKCILLAGRGMTGPTLVTQTTTSSIRASLASDNYRPRTVPRIFMDMVRLCSQMVVYSSLADIRKASPGSCRSRQSGAWIHANRTCHGVRRTCQKTVFRQDAGRSRIRGCREIEC